MAEKDDLHLTDEASVTASTQGFVFDGKAKSDSFKTYDELSVEVGARNECVISCAYCRSKILQPQMASLVDKEVGHLCCRAL
jgi:hypothetical protein